MLTWTPLNPPDPSRYYVVSATCNGSSTACASLNTQFIPVSLPPFTIASSFSSNVTSLSVAAGVVYGDDCDIRTPICLPLTVTTNSTPRIVPGYLVLGPSSTSIKFPLSVPSPGVITNLSIAPLPNSSLLLVWSAAEYSAGAFFTVYISLATTVPCLSASYNALMFTTVTNTAVVAGLFPFSGYRVSVTQSTIIKGIPFEGTPFVGVENTLSGPPQPPTAPFATVLSTTSIRVTWVDTCINADAITSYKIYVYDAELLDSPCVSNELPVPVGNDFTTAAHYYNLDLSKDFSVNCVLV